jgi:hypothetical protein
MGYFTIRVTWLSRDISEFEIFVIGARGDAEDAIMEKRGRISEVPIYFFFV